MAYVFEYFKAEVWKEMNMLLSFDVEEFDLPREYLIYISEEEMYLQSYRGLLRILDLLDKYKVRATFFVTLNFAKKYPELIREVSEKHEIGCHGYSHIDNYSKNGVERILEAKKGIEKIIGKKIYGFRAPRGNRPEFKDLSKTGFVYDSSLNPTLGIGRYNNLNESRRIFRQDGLFEIPWAVSQYFRMPMSWVLFRNFGLAYSKILTKLNNLDFTALVFHPWEFVDVKQDVPFYMKRKTGDEFLRMLEEYMKWGLGREYNFETYLGYLRKKDIVS
jgi:peptidoglycan/xylan/chitin deacetylase (PgdA/CDA1 family)